MGNKLTGRDLIKLGFPKNNSINIALGQISRYRKREKKTVLLTKPKMCFCILRSIKIMELGAK